ncbi:MAG TPA: M15 family metallopeptidase [Thermoanaerobaculia bacterium]|nr:M15 family metallopeptidase [Thermoanaerobaculia bacterium]
MTRSDSKKPADPSLDPVLPFGDFVTSLRDRGVPVGTREYLAIAKLLSRWKGIQRETLRDAFSALLARKPEEVQAVAAAFDEWFPAKEQPVPTTRSEEMQRVTPNRAWIVAVALMLLGVSAAAGYQAWDQLRIIWPTDPPRIVKKTGNSGVDPPRVQQKDCVPAPPRGHAASIPITASVLGALLVLNVAQIMRTRQRRREWQQRHTADKLASVPGPIRYQTVLLDETPPIPREWVDEVAGILGRMTAADRVSDQLDVEETLRRTLRAGSAVQFAFEPLPGSGTVLFLQDTSFAMRLWRPKVEFFIDTLLRQGVRMDRWYFDTNPAVVWRERRAQRTSLETLAESHGDASLLMIGGGEGLAGALSRDRLDVLQRWTYRAWLNPIRRREYWPKALADAPIRSWPMTRHGMRGAAWELARSPRVVPEEVGDIPRAVTADDIERVKRLIALAHSPTVALLHALRRRYAPDVPEEVVLFLADPAMFGGEEYRLPGDEVARLVAAERHDAPVREIAIRRHLIDALRLSEPAPGSLASERWKLDLAMQKVQLAIATNESGSAPVDDFRKLAERGMVKEVTEAIGSLDAQSGIAALLRRIVQRVVSTIPPVVPATTAAQPPGISWPGRAGLLLALVAGAVLLWLTQPLGEARGELVQHLEGAYRLSYGPPTTGAEAGTLRILLTNPNAPRQVTLYICQRNLDLVTLEEGVEARVRIDPALAGNFFQARASQLPAGNLALSNSVWVPAYQAPKPTPPSDELTVRVIELIAGSLAIDPATITEDSNLVRDLKATELGLGRIEETLYDAFHAELPEFDDQTTVRTIVAWLRPSSVVPAITVHVNGPPGAEQERFSVVVRSDDGTITASTGMMINVPVGRSRIEGDSSNYRIVPVQINMASGEYRHITVQATAKVEPAQLVPARLQELEDELGPFLSLPESGRQRWIAANIVYFKLPFEIPFAGSGTPVKSIQVHRRAVPIFEAVLLDVERSGLISTISSYGGGFAYRPAAGTSFLSSHAYGVAIDLNSKQNPRGTPGRMDPRLVEIFEKHGFAWGGDYTGRTDPMHFELRPDVLATSGQSRGR